MELIKSSQYMKLIELRNRWMVLNITCRDTHSKIQSKKKVIHVRDTIVDRGYIWDLRKHNIKS